MNQIEVIELLDPLAGLISDAEELKRKDKENKVLTEILELTKFGDNFPNFDDGKDEEKKEEKAVAEYKKRAAILAELTEKLKNDFSIDIYQDENWVAQMNNLLEVKEWLEKIFGVKTSEFDTEVYSPVWKKQIAGSLGEKEEKELLMEHETDNLFTFADAKDKSNLQRTLAGLIKVVNDVEIYLGEDDLDHLPARPDSLKNSTSFLRRLIWGRKNFDELSKNNTELDIWERNELDLINGVDKNKVKDYVDKKAAAEKYENKLKVLLADEKGKSPDSVAADSGWENDLIRKNAVNNKNEELGKLEVERDIWKERVRLAKEASKNTRQKIKTHQDALTTAKADALAALQIQKGDLNDNDINDQIQADDTTKSTNNWAGQADWSDKLQPNDPTFTTAQELSAYVLAVSEAIGTLKKQKEKKELNEVKSDILIEIRNNLLQGSAITDTDINKLLNITGNDDWKNFFKDTDDRINNLKGLTDFSNGFIHVINQLKINQDLKAAKAQALIDLMALKENVSDGDINDAAEKLQENIIPTSGDWKTKLKDTNKEIKSTEELTRYVHVITDAISKVKGATDIKNAKKHAADRLDIFKGTLNDNDITAMAEEIEPNITSGAVWTQKLQANNAIIINAEQLSHYVKIITRAISKLNTNHDLKQAKVQTRVALQNLIQTSGLTDDQINAKIVEFSSGIPAGNTNWRDKLKENDTTLTDAKALTEYITLLTRGITASKGADTTTELNQVKGERNNLEDQVKLVRSELSIGADVADVVNNKLTVADLADYKTAKTNLTTRENEIKHAIYNNAIPNGWQNNVKDDYDKLRTKINGNPTGTLPNNWENDLVKKNDLDTEKAKITTLKNDLGVIKNDNSIDAVRVNQIKDNEAELTRINNDIIAKIKTKTNLKTLIKLNANNKNELDTARLDAIETILSTPANASAADVLKYKNKLQGLGIAVGQEKPGDSWENELMNKKPLTQAGYSDFNVMLADLNSLKTEKSDFQNKLSQQQENCRKEKEALQTQIEQKEQDLLKFMVEQLNLNLTGDKYERQQVLAEIQKLIVNPDTNQETTLANLRQKITEQEKEIKKLREQNKENIPAPEFKQQAEKVLKELGLKNSYQTQIDKITSLSELTDFYQQAAKNEIGKVKGEKDQMRNWNIALWLLFVGNLLITTFVIMKVKGGKTLGKKDK
ncbi:protein of unknown function [endosymbiont DhMRE of Dentiscutata heterogama]|uniref:hypothetical protein n=1 Tax=endosymbiont DhMRE of Dentiscutata heterogama TaxID=1609546 RepID=UPI000629D78A|nr:hypothetical protein [endosymbiont DhMRE of Dentiscutata heterogama]CFW92814.1 protein of unknown function [endosymbiont DhMRE of Dentiscutata heterogama]